MYMHILHNRHECVPASSTLKLLKQCPKGNIMNIWEAMYIQAYNQHDLLVPEQNCMDHNPLFSLAHMPRNNDTVEMSNSHSPTLHWTTPTKPTGTKHARYVQFITIVAIDIQHYKSIAKQLLIISHEFTDRCQAKSNYQRNGSNRQTTK
jgi:hypothetical protein